MRANGRLHKTILGYLKALKDEGCFSYNGEYPKKMEVKLRSIHKQLDEMIERDK